MYAQPIGNDGPTLRQGLRPSQFTCFDPEKDALHRNAMQDIGAVGGCKTQGSPDYAGNTRHARTPPTKRINAPQPQAQN